MNTFGGRQWVQNFDTQTKNSRAKSSNARKIKIIAVSVATIVVVAIVASLIVAPPKSKPQDQKKLQSLSKLVSENHENMAKLNTLIRGVYREGLTLGNLVPEDNENTSKYIKQLENYQKSLDIIKNTVDDYSGLSKTKQDIDLSSNISNLKSTINKQYDSYINFINTTKKIITALSYEDSDKINTSLGVIATNINFANFAKSLVTYRSANKIIKQYSCEDIESLKQNYSTCYPAIMQREQSDENLDNIKLSQIYKKAIGDIDYAEENTVIFYLNNIREVLNEEE